MGIAGGRSTYRSTSLMIEDDDPNREALAMAYSLLAAQEGDVQLCVEIATSVRDTMDEVIEILVNLFDTDDDT